VATTGPIPFLPNGSWPAYSKVETFLIAEHNREGAFTPTYDELGQLTRLAADLRTDADHLVGRRGFLGPTRPGVPGEKGDDSG
jgi:hypothetical protein